jgi:hypothetical protein
MTKKEKRTVMKISSHNPFPPTFGSVPPLMAGRDILIKLRLFSLLCWRMKNFSQKPID